MAHHNYRAEPNVRFSPDKKYVFFTSNMFGPSYIFGVEVKKSENPPATEIQSTPELARKFNPVEPTPTTNAEIGPRSAQLVLHQHKSTGAPAFAGLIAKDGQ